jgi:S-DNA-T family DNA segregation ATPase FtsK/SpoIIIE
MKQTLDFGRRPEDAEEILLRIKDDMEDRLNWLYENGFNSVKQAGIKERHFVIIDEAADIANKKKCMNAVTDIARRGRSAGYRLIYATQYPTNETLPSQVRANIGNRIVLRLETSAQSLASLDESGAEKLPEIEGRAIFRQVTNKIVQAPLISQDLIDSTIKINLRGKDESVEFTKRAEGGQNTIEFKKS